MFLQGIPVAQVCSSLSGQGCEKFKCDLCDAVVHLQQTADFKNAQTLFFFFKGLSRADLNLSSYSNIYFSDFIFGYICIYFHVCFFFFSLNDGLEQTHFSSLFLMLSGSDTGFGHALAKYLDNLGFVVFAGVLNKDGPGAEELRRTCSRRVSLLQLDITNATQVKEAYLKVSEKVQNTGTAFFLCKRIR